MKKVLFLLSNILGNETFSARVVESVGHMPQLQPRFIHFDGSDYLRYEKRVPWLKRVTHTLVPAHMARMKFDESGVRDFDCLFLQGFTFLPGFADLVKTHPTVVAHDSTDLLAYRLAMDHDGPLVRGLKRLQKSVTTPRYREAVGPVRAFLPRTRWCARSLIGDYGVDPARICVTPAAVDLARWIPADHASRDPAAPLNLLWVGNDFRRKGGEFLMSLYARHLGHRARLRLISNDPALGERNLPAGVEWIRGLRGRQDEIARHFRESDVFVFPTLRDHLAIVLIEATAAGLPIVAADVGGTSEAVRPDENGFLLPPGASEEAWAAKILELAEDPAKRAAFGRRSRALAEEHFSRTLFEKRLASALDLLERGGSFPPELAYREAGGPAMTSA